MFNQIHEFNQLIPVETPLGEGYLLYVCNPGMYTNACYAVVLEDGRIRHFMDHQITVVRNDTLQIFPKEAGSFTDESGVANGQTIPSRNDVKGS